MPTPRPNSTVITDMDLGDALRDVARGCKITRREWNNATRVFLRGGVLHIDIAEDVPEIAVTKGLHKYIVSEADLLATDWIVAL